MVVDEPGDIDREILDDAAERASKRCKLTEGVADIGQQLKEMQVMLSFCQGRLMLWNPAGSASPGSGSQATADACSVA